jgi:ribosomal protein S18 acetylase RimI-like enzyme
MAALTDAHVPAPLGNGPRVVELRQVRPDQLEHVLTEEAGAWARELDWDFTGSAALVKRFLEMQALSGFCLVAGGRPAGYSYYVCESGKGLIGDLYIVRENSTAAHEHRLLGAVLDALVNSALVRRVESQLMMLRWPERASLPRRDHAHIFPRQFMRLDLQRVAALPRRDVRATTFDHWSERRQDEAASLVAASYRGHVDSEINDQYRSPAGARKFLANIIQYPGCGAFFQPASFMALDNNTGRLCGMCLSSLVAQDVGHITQVCVLPGYKGKGCGYELIRRSLEALARAGCRSASLTVTTANSEAIHVYEQIGFTTTRNFSACVWEGF